MTDDTINTLTPEAMLTTLTWLACASCGGEKRKQILFAHNIYADPTFPENWEEWAPCPSCQDATGAATGLLMPGLSEKCPFAIAVQTMEYYEETGPYRLIHGAECELCHREHDDRIPRQHDVLEAVLEEIWNMTANVTLKLGQPGISNKEAAIASLYQALVAKGLVGD